MMYILISPLQRKGGQWSVYYTSLQSFIATFFFVGLTTLEILVNFDLLIH